jgi:hypothetical protein
MQLTVESADQFRGLLDALHQYTDSQRIYLEDHGGSARERAKLAATEAYLDELARAFASPLSTRAQEE